MPKVKYGQIGVGHAHASKMSVYRESDDFEVVGVVEPDPALRAKAEKSAAYKDLKWMTQEQLLNMPGLQVVGVETRVRDLLDTAETCVDAGLHVHIDKPAGESLPQFKRILDAAARKHLLVQMGYMYRYNPAVVMLRDFLQKGYLGEPFEVHTVMSKVIAAGTRQSLAEYRGGTIFELGCHIIDLVIGVLGKPELVTPYNQHASPLGDKLLDNMLAVFTYPRALATVKSSAMEVEGFARRHFVVCGSEGTFHIEPLDRPDVRFALSKPRSKYVKGYQDVKIGEYRRYVGDAADMARIVRGEKQADFSYEHDLAVQTAVLQASGLPLT
ncbi:MAG: Gfo/Idh/MocA family oxidoreductase [Planctomycetaceae bacterium]|jgi:predicted dehydrogenase|nr:Gfo/Idh/MocA family oxidoreductase [Planctomycetaceae bacterium]MBT6486599.1 Gfo/Idh/MocA family oxidoreductase [Planctomycetaceae bacterium]